MSQKMYLLFSNDCHGLRQSDHVCYLRMKSKDLEDLSTSLSHCFKTSVGIVALLSFMRMYVDKLFQMFWQEGRIPLVDYFVFLQNSGAGTLQVDPQLIS